MVFPLGNEASTATRPWLTWALILANLAGFVVEQARPFSFLVAYSATPYEITRGVDIARPLPHDADPTDPPREGLPEPSEFVHQAPGPRPIRLTLLTSLFLHADLFHLAGNLLFLSVFGPRVEDALGRGCFLALYLTAGVVGTLAMVVAMPDSLTPTLGASGAVAGVMGASLVRFPRDRVRVLILNILVLVPASVVIGCWIAVQLIHTSFVLGAVSRSGNLAYLAHLGGAATGIAAGLASRRWRPAQVGDRAD